MFLIQASVVERRLIDKRLQVDVVGLLRIVVTNEDPLVITAAMKMLPKKEEERIGKRLYLSG
jgi:hypothetical protein